MTPDGLPRERDASAPKPPQSTRTPRRWWLAVVGAGVVVSLAAGALVFAEFDSDGDGLTNAAEIAGWRVAGGEVYSSNPWSVDTDEDGLTDREEAGTLRVSADGDPTYEGLSDPTLRDSDRDGLDDRSEVRGWLSTRNVTFRSDPMREDSDGDGLSDALEAGPLVGSDTYEAVSDPLKVDSDDDELTDLDEIDLSIDAFNADSDGDRLSDAQEVDQFGTAPDDSDTDADGFDDAFEIANRETRGLDPLWPDEEVAASSYAWDFAQGAVLGEVAPGDSLGWLAGNLASGASSFIPGVGWVVGSAADVRDAVGAAIHADWVGAGFSVIGLAPVGGDAAAVPAKVAKFVARHPALAASVGATIVRLTWVPKPVKVSALKATAPADWDFLRAQGVSEASLLRLQEGRSTASALATSTKRSGDVARARAPFFASGRAGEEWLESLYPAVGGAKHSQIVMRTNDCIDVCNAFARRFDVFADGVAHESKVGYVTLTKSVERQIRSDAYLVKRGEGGLKSAHWHFLASDQSKSIGATKPVLDLLDELDIEYTIHLPS